MFLSLDAIRVFCENVPSLFEVRLSRSGSRYSWSLGGTELAPCAVVLGRRVRGDVEERRARWAVTIVEVEGR